jgi:hypothetical protein
MITLSMLLIVLALLFVIWAALNKVPLVWAVLLVVLERLVDLAVIIGR